MPKKEEEFWKDLAFRMVNYIGWTAKEVVKRIRPNCSVKTKKCLVIDTDYTWPFAIMCCNNWKTVVSAICKATGYITQNMFSVRRNMFSTAYREMKNDKSNLEKYVIELDLAGFGDLAEAIQKGKI